VGFRSGTFTRIYNDRICSTRGRNTTPSTTIESPGSVRPTIRLNENCLAPLSYPTTSVILISSLVTPYTTYGTEQNATNMSFLY
jgi:hypothetical protein